MLAWTTVERSPYRGDRAPSWKVVEVEPEEGGRRSLDVGALLQSELMGPGVLRARSLEDGRIELLCPRSEEIRARTPDGRERVGRRRLAVPFGSVIAFRDVVVAVLIGDEAVAATGGATEFLDVPAA